MPFGTFKHHSMQKAARYYVSNISNPVYQSMFPDFRAARWLSARQACIAGVPVFLSGIHPVLTDEGMPDLTDLKANYIDRQTVTHLRTKNSQCKATLSSVSGRVPTWNYFPQQHANLTRFSCICCYFTTASDWTTDEHHDSGLAASIFWLTSFAAVRSISSSSCLFMPFDLYTTTKQNRQHRKYSREWKRTTR